MTVTLVDFDGIIDFVDDDRIISDVVHHAASSASLKISAECRWKVGPDLDTCAILFDVN